jgi:hypothetical protein
MDDAIVVDSLRIRSACGLPRREKQRTSCAEE